MAKKKSKLKKHDFVQLDYTGRFEDGSVFDTTDEKTAKDAGIDRENATFGPVTICLGGNHMLPAIEEHLIGKEPKKYDIKLKAEDAFGKKSAKLLTLIPMRVFRKEDIKPFPGLEVNIDDRYGVVRSVSGGRVIVDFNHPLSGHDVQYKIKVKKLIEDPIEKAKTVFKNELNMPDIKLELDKKTLLIDEKIPEQVIQPIKKRILELIPDITDVALKKEDKKEAESKTKKKSSKKKTSKKSSKKSKKSNK